MIRLKARKGVSTVAVTFVTGIDGSTSTLPHWWV